MTTIHERVFAAGARHPGRVAIDGETPIRYGELTAAAQRLADLLAELVPPGRPVAVLSAKRPATVVSFLAALAAGRPYVPVDPSAPPRRRDFVLRDAGAPLLLVPEGQQPADCPVPVVAVPEDPAGVQPGRPRRTPERPSPDHDAYLLYTSGSTGTPKGVRISHRNAAAFVGWAATAFPLRPGDAVAVHAPLHFDLPVYDLYVGLGAGATLHLVDERVALFPQALLDFLVTHRITSLYAVPSALTSMVYRTEIGAADLSSLRQLLYAGEEFRPEPLAALWAAIPDASVANLYGPIETNVITSWRLTRADLSRSRIPIGTPVSGATIVLFGSDGRASEREAMEGEILVSGDCVTPGYLNRPELTDRAMVTVTTESGPMRCYRTGDHAVRDGAGVLHLAGRRDGLVKTRGYRVEIGEVESVIGRHPAVAEVAVVARPDPRLTNRLDAVVAPRPGRSLTAATVLRHCRELLPGYMVPSGVVVRTDLPRTSTGKIARSALPELLEVAR